MNEHERFLCPTRTYIPNSPYIEADRWYRRKNGDYCCSYCHSAHPEQFLQFCKLVTTNRDLDLRIQFRECVDRWYMIRSTVRDVSEGAIKCLSKHLLKWMEDFDQQEKVLWMKFVKDAQHASFRKYLILNAD